MRLFFPSATISAIVVASPSKAKATRAAALKSHVAGGDDIEGGAPSSTLIVGNECNPSSASNDNANALHTAKRGKAAADVGVLASVSSQRSCYDRAEAVCIPDESSTLGGRCHDASREIGKSSFDYRRFLLQSTANRFLPEEEEDVVPFVCPADTCPAELCECAASTEFGWPDARDCAIELHAVCTSASTSTSNNGISDCFNDEYTAFYEEVYCEFASCWLDGNSYEDCDCEYYVNYCALYESYADGYPEVAKKCEVAGCCKEASGSAEKMSCVPGSSEGSAVLEEVVVVNRTAGMLNGTTADDVTQNTTDELASTPHPFEFEKFEVSLQRMSNDMPITEDITGPLSPTDSPWIDMSTSAFGITTEPTSAPTATPLRFSSTKHGDLENGGVAGSIEHISSWITTIMFVGVFWILA